VFYTCISIRIPRKEQFKPQGVLRANFGYYNIIIVVADEKGRENLKAQGDELIQKKEYYDKIRASRQQRINEKI